MARPEGGAGAADEAGGRVTGGGNRGDTPEISQIGPEPATGTAGLGQADRVRVWAYAGQGTGVRANVPVEEVSDLLDSPTTLVWVDLTDPEPAALATLQAECRLHPLAVEDVQREHQRPKVDEYGHFYFVVFYVPEYDAGARTIHLHEIALFLGDHWLVTVHDGPVREIEESVRRWQQNADELGLSLGTLLYSLLDSMIDAYFPVVDSIGDDVDEVQEAIFAHADRETLQRLTQMRRTLLHLRRVLAPQREVVNTLLRRDQPILPVATTPYFHDLYDHIVRLIDTIDTYRDLLGAALDSYLSVTSNNLNEVMKTLTSWSIMLMSASLIASIYGMNFDLMPELRWPIGYPLALGMMLVVIVVLNRYFRRRGWL